MNTEIPELHSDGLRRFAFTTSSLIAGLFGLFFPLLHRRPLPVWPWIIAAVLTLWGMFLPARLQMLYRGWMKLAGILGRVNSTLILSALFIGILSPLGVVMRLFGYDPLLKKIPINVPSYRKQSQKPRHNSMEKPY